MSTELDVEALPRRVAHVVHAIMEASGPYAHGSGILTAREIMLYDAEALSPKATAAGLREAQRRYGLVSYIGKGLWLPTNLALDHKRAFEDRYIRETDEFFSS